MLFLYALNSPITRERYSTRLRYFLSKIALTNGSFEELCRIFVEKGKQDPNWVIDNIVAFLIQYKDRYDRREISGSLFVMMMTTTQTAEAANDNCKIEEDGDTTCSSGEGDVRNPPEHVGGSGSLRDCDSGGNCFISGGGGGRTQLVGDEHLVGGGGGKIFCTDNPPPCPGSGGGGEHIQGAGGNSGG
jgi:hypothetical protein